MNAREIMKQAIADDVNVGVRTAHLDGIADQMHDALTAAGYRVLAPGELDRETVERCGNALREMKSRYGALVMREEAATALRALHGREG